MSKRSKIMTEEELLGLLDEDLAWRKKEMVEYRFLVDRLKENEGGSCSCWNCFALCTFRRIYKKGIKCVCSVCGFTRYPI